MSSLRDIRLTYTEEKREQDKGNVWIYLVIRRLSFYPTWAFLKLGISANQATFISIVVGILGCAFLAAGGYRNSVVGALLVSGWSVLDCVDGNLARLTGSASRYGGFLDGLTGYMMSAFLLTSVGIGVFSHPDNVMTSLTQLFSVAPQTGVDRALPLILGAWGSLAALFYGLVFESFENIYSQPVFRDNPGEAVSSGRLSIILAIGRNIVGFGLLEPVLLVAAILGCLSLLVGLYALIHSGAAAFSVFQALRMAKEIS